MSKAPDFHGIQAQNDLLELHFADDNGPIAIYIPTAAIPHLCGQPLDAAELNTVMLAHVAELFPLIDSVCEAKGGFTVACWESGVSYRRLDIDLEAIVQSGIRFSTDVLVMAKAAGFADPRTGAVMR